LNRQEASSWVAGSGRPSESKKAFAAMSEDLQDRFVGVELRQSLCDQFLVAHGRRGPAIRSVVLSATGILQVGHDTRTARSGRKVDGSVSRVRELPYTERLPGT